MLEETLLHKGSAEEWNSVMINEHLPGKPLQHNLIFSILGLYRSTHAWQVRWRVEVTTMPVTSLVVYVHPSYTTKAATAYIHTYSTHTSKMNSLNALGNRQISSLQADLAKMENGESGPSVQG